MNREPFGSLADGRRIDVLTIGEAPGPVVQVLELGATVHRLEVTGGDGRRRNVTLGLGSLGEYLASTAYLGATVGRYANRIAGGRLHLDGRAVQLGINDGENHLHGGPDGFSRRPWTVERHDPDVVELSLVSKDGDQGYPGTLEVGARFETGPRHVRLELTATTDRPTLVNLTSHTYFNLDGDVAGTVDDHELQLAADEYVPVDDTGIPIGGPEPVTGTPFDFREPRPIGPAIRSDHAQIRGVRGLDHNVVLRREPGRPAAVVTSRRTATRMELYTDQPGLQVYSGNFLDGSERSAAGQLLRQGDGLALEPQTFPDSPNWPEFPPPWLAPGQIYRAFVEWRFRPADQG